MRKKMINKVVALAFIIGGLSLSKPVEAAGYCWDLFPICVDGCINNYGPGLGLALASCWEECLELERLCDLSYWPE